MLYFLHLVLIQEQMMLLLPFYYKYMALAIALKMNEKIFLGSERKGRNWPSKWDGFIKVHNFYIAIKNPLYHFIISELKNNIVIQNIESIKMVDLLFQNIQETIETSKIEGISQWKRYDIEMMACSKNHIWNLCNSGSITEHDFSVISENTWARECVTWYISTINQIDQNKKKSSKKILKDILTRYGESGWKIKIIEL